MTTLEVDLDFTEDEIQVMLDNLDQYTPEEITEITKQYIRNNMPDGTTEILIPEGVDSIDSHAF